jgi:hypothetical protein
MAAPKGNQFWKARTKHGRDKIFASADLLWEACQEYFQWVEDNPLWEMKSYMYQGAPVQDQLPKMRAMTIQGLCLFLDVDDLTWRRWRDDKDFCTITTRAEKVIYMQKFSGAAADQLNANIIARDLGLVDKQEQKQIKSLEDCDDDELDRIIRERQQALDKAKQD